MGGSLDLLSVFCLLLFIRSMGSYLLMLIILELLVFMGFLFYMDVGNLGWGNQCFSLSLLFLVLMIFEGVFGLCLLLFLLRSEGNGQYLYW